MLRFLGIEHFAQARDAARSDPLPFLVVHGIERITAEAARLIEHLLGPLDLHLRERSD